MRTILMNVRDCWILWKIESFCLRSDIDRLYFINVGCLRKEVVEMADEMVLFDSETICAMLRVFVFYCGGPLRLIEPTHSGLRNAY